MYFYMHAPCLFITNLQEAPVFAARMPADCCAIFFKTIPQEVGLHVAYQSSRMRVDVVCSGLVVGWFCSNLQSQFLTLF